VRRGPRRPARRPRCGTPRPAAGRSSMWSYVHPPSDCRQSYSRAPARQATSAGGSDPAGSPTVPGSDSYAGAMSSDAASAAPSPDLAEALRRAADAPTLVVACDYDGTLAPFVDDPTRAVPAPGATAALARLARLPRTTVALLSGRNRAALAEVSGAGAPVVLVGSHGSEWEGGFDAPR